MWTQFILIFSFIYLNSSDACFPLKSVGSRFNLTYFHGFFLLNRQIKNSFVWTLWKQSWDITTTIKIFWLILRYSVSNRPFNFRSYTRSFLWERHGKRVGHRMWSDPPCNTRSDIGALSAFKVELVACHREAKADLEICL